MPIIKNPRKDDTFENENIRCSICNNLSSYLYYLSPHYDIDDELDINDPSIILICKGCLANFIEEINTEIIRDLKDAKREM